MSWGYGGDFSFEYVLNKTAKSCSGNRIKNLCVSHRPNSTVSETWRVFLLPCNSDPENVYFFFFFCLSHSMLNLFIELTDFVMILF